MVIEIVGMDYIKHNYCIGSWEEDRDGDDKISAQLGNFLISRIFFLLNGTCNIQ